MVWREAQVHGPPCARSLLATPGSTTESARLVDQENRHRNQEENRQHGGRSACREPDHAQDDGRDRGCRGKQPEQPDTRPCLTSPRDAAHHQPRIASVQVGPVDDLVLAELDTCSSREVPDARRREPAGEGLHSPGVEARRHAPRLTRLRDRLGGRFAAGIVLHTGTTSGPLGDKIAAVPLDILWEA